MEELRRSICSSVIDHAGMPSLARQFSGDAAVQAEYGPQAVNSDTEWCLTSLRGIPPSHSCPMRPKPGAPGGIEVSLGFSR